MLQIVFDMEGTLLTTHNGKVEVMDGVAELLLRLSQKHEIYLWTARGRGSTEQILKNLGWWSYFKEIKTATDAPPKPNPEALEMMLDLDVKTILVGDSFQDMIGAKKFGALAVGACWYHDPSETLKEFGADEVCFKLSELEKIISREDK